MHIHKSWSYHNIYNILLLSAKVCWFLLTTPADLLVKWSYKKLELLEFENDVKLTTLCKLKCLKIYHLSSKKLQATSKTIWNTIAHKTNKETYEIRKFVWSVTIRLDTRANIYHML